MKLYRIKFRETYLYKRQMTTGKAVLQAVVFLSWQDRCYARSIYSADFTKYLYYAGDIMNSLNQIILEGNVVRQPECRQLQTGTMVCTMPIAVDHSYKNSSGELQQEVSYFDIDTFGKLADVCFKWAGIGRRVRIVGRLKQDRWKNQEGKNQSKIHVIAEHVELLALGKKQREEWEQKKNSGSEASGINTMEQSAQVLSATNMAAVQEEDCSSVPF